MSRWVVLLPVVLLAVILVFAWLEADYYDRHSTKEAPPEEHGIRL